MIAKVMFLCLTLYIFMMDYFTEFELAAFFVYLCRKFIEYRGIDIEGG